MKPYASPTSQTLEPRLALAGDIASLAAQVAADVNLDGSVTVGDAFAIVADLRHSGASDAIDAATQRFDANQDGRISLADALSVIVQLRNGSDGQWLDNFDWLTEQRRENIHQFLSNLSQLRLESFVSPESIAQLVADLTTALEGAQTPAPESIDTLLANLETALADDHLSEEETELLHADLAAVLESAGVSESDIEAIHADIDAILESGVAPFDLNVLVGDIRLVIEAFPGLTGDRLEAIDQLIADLHDLTEDSLPDEADLADLADAFDSLAAGATVPDYTLIANVVADIRAARLDGEIDDTEREGIAASIDLVLESANIGSDEREALRDAFDDGFRGLFQELLDLGRRFLDLFPIFRR